MVFGVSMKSKLPFLLPQVTARSLVVERNDESLRLRFWEVPEQ